MMEASAVRLEGSVIGYDDLSDGGATVTRSFCGVCGTPVETASEAARVQHLRIIKAGLFAGSREFPPRIEIFCGNRQNWIPAFSATTTFLGMP